MNFASWLSCSIYRTQQLALPSRLWGWQGRFSPPANHFCSGDERANGVEDLVDGLEDASVHDLTLTPMSGPVRSRPYAA
jgi:hypothetical protein